MNYTSKHIAMIAKIIENKHNIEVIRTPKYVLTSSANYHGLAKSITLGTRGWCHVILAALVHEYGHVKSHALKLSPPMQTSLFYRFGVVLSKRDGKRLVAEEKRAWRLGFKLLKDSGIEVNSDILKVRDILVQTHVKRTTKLLKRNKR